MLAYLRCVRNWILPSIIGLLAIGATSSAQAVVLFEEHFNTDVPDETTFDATYPAFTTTSATSVQVISGVLNMTGSGALASIPGYASDVVIKGDISAIGSDGGSFNVGLRVGGLSFIFHPGYAPIPGAFRNEGITGNQSMGYIPASGTLHHFELRQIPTTGEFRLKVIDGNNPLNVFSYNYTSLANVGGAIGFLRSGGLTTPGIYDNLIVETSAQLEVTPVENSLISIPGGGASLLPDAITLKNTGLDDSTIDIISYNITGPDAAFFSLPDFVPTTLTAGGLDTVSFDLGFSGTGTQTYLAGLTIVTSLGDVSFDLQATIAPEPGSLSLALFGIVALWRKRRRPVVV